jgi:hypothetical protein
MYVAPRIKLEDDPLFPARMACVVVLGLGLAIYFRSPMPPIYPAVMFGMMAGMRGAYNPIRAALAPVSLTLAMWIMSGVVTLFLPLPAVLFVVIALIMFGAFYLAIKSSNPVAMLLLMPLILMSIMGISSYDSMILMRAEMTKAGFFTLLAAPVLYYLLPTRATWFDDPVYTPVHSDGIAVRAAIRTAVLMMFCGWIYAVLGAANLMLALGATFVLLFPTRDTLLTEAKERSHATLLGGGIGVAIMAIIGVIAQPIFFILLVALGTVYMSHKMATGRHPGMVYQFGASAMISVATAAIGGQEPTYALMTRLVLTFGGAIAAAFLTVFLENIFLGKKAVEATA